jgi:hypothetical protein
MPGLTDTSTPRMRGAASIPTVRDHAWKACQAFQIGVSKGSVIDCGSGAAMTLSARGPQ